MIYDHTPTIKVLDMEIVCLFLSRTLRVGVRHRQRRVPLRIVPPNRNDAKSLTL
jgi:hypothetical protein